MRLAIIGEGLLGRTLFDAAAAEDDDDGSLVMLGHDDIDITSSESIKRALEPHGSQVAINTAALHNVVECEKDPARTYRVNAQGAERLAELVPTIFISTDYVFNDGGPHDEVLPGQQPRSIYGRSKLGGEIATLEHGGIVVRVASLFGHHASHKGPTFPQKVLSSHDPMTLATDQVMSPTYVPDVAPAILRLARLLAVRKAEGIYHCTNRGHASWAEFAEHICTMVGHERHILPRKVNDPIRPKNTILRNTRLPAFDHWLPALGRWATAEGRRTFVSPLRD